MEVRLLIAAFGLGFAARAVKLPSLVGYLIAGFAAAMRSWTAAGLAS
jgi:predicted Kef-type K+ transport protein